MVGHGEVKAKPDIATTNVGVEVTAPTVVDAMAEANTKMADVLAAVKKLGIADRDIQTSNFSINFERQSGSTLQSPTNGSATASSDSQRSGVYRVSNMVQITIRNLDQVGSVLDAVVKAGANNVWGVNFRSGRSLCAGSHRSREGSGRCSQSSRYPGWVERC